VGTMGQAISLRVPSLRAISQGRGSDWDAFALLTPSCGGPSADREEKRETHGNGTSDPASTIRSSLTPSPQLERALSTTDVEHVLLGKAVVPAAVLSGQQVRILLVRARELLTRQLSGFPLSTAAVANTKAVLALTGGLGSHC